MPAEKLMVSQSAGKGHTISCYRRSAKTRKRFVRIDARIIN
jgi:hypothetical protein